MSTNQKLWKILDEGIAGCNDVAMPEYLTSYMALNKEDKKLNDSMSIFEIKNSAERLTKPAVAVVGAFASGKTFLLRKILEEIRLISDTGKTTSVITVFRHVSDKPKSWSTEHDVFVMRRGFDLRSLDPDSVLKAVDFDELKNVTAYRDESDDGTNSESDAVLIFLNSPILKSVIFYDCPGVGTSLEGDDTDESDVDESSEIVQAAVREKTLQNRAIREADACIALSPMMGTGAFQDANTSNIFNAIAEHAPLFPCTTKHGNLLLVGSRADPLQTGLEIEEDVMSRCQSATVQIIENLPADKRKKLDFAAIKQRIVLLHYIDDISRNSTINSIAKALKRVMQNATEAEIYKIAETQFEEEERSQKERTEGFERSLRKMVSELVLGVEQYQIDRSMQSLKQSKIHYANKASDYANKANFSKEYHQLSAIYAEQYDAREDAWNKIVTSFEKDVDIAFDDVIEDLDTNLSNWSEKDNVYKFLKREYGDDKNMAKSHGADDISQQLTKKFGRAITLHAEKPQTNAVEELRKFDKKWLPKLDSKFQLTDESELNASGIEVGHLGGISMANTLGNVTAALAGGTTLAAVAGSSIAQIAFIKTLSLGVAAAGSVGFGTAAAGLYFIPVYGWLILAVGGLYYGLRGLFAWRDTLAKKIAKGMKKSKGETLNKARIELKEAFDETKRLGIQALSQSKSVLDAHIIEVDQIASGEVHPDDLVAAKDYFNDTVQCISTVQLRLNQLDNQSKDSEDAAA